MEKELTWAGKERYTLEVADSTNIQAAEYARKGCSHGTLIIANAQEAGKGRRGRSWTSEAGAGIYMSLVLRPQFRPDHAAGLTLAAALSVAKAIEAVADITPQIKWPNDVVINKKKICGILTEMHLKGMEIDFVVVGIGVNVHGYLFPEEIKNIATSLDKETGRIHSRSCLIEEILLFFEEYYEKYLITEDVSLFRQEYEDYLANMNEKVKVLDPAGEYEGCARGITNSGELIVDTENTLRYVTSGEVSVRGIYGYV